MQGNNYDLYGLVLSIIGGLFGIYKYIVSVINRKKKNKNIENILKAEKLALQIEVASKELTILEFKDRLLIENNLDYFTDVHKANYAHFSVVKNGGDHITSRKTCTISVLYEKYNYNKTPKKRVWQNIIVNSQLAEILLNALLNGYHYIHNFMENMEDGDMKKSINPMNGHDVGWFYVGKIDIDEYFLSFQFRADGIQSEYEKQEIKNYASSIYDSLKKTNQKRNELKTMIVKKKRLEHELLDYKLDN